MQALKISDPSDPPKLPRGTKAVHLCARPSIPGMVEIIKSCPKLEQVSMSPTASRDLARGFTRFLEMQGVRLVITIATPRCEYVEVDVNV